jgi:hypothetical protein
LVVAHCMNILRHNFWLSISHMVPPACALDEPSRDTSAHFRPGLTSTSPLG